MRVFLDTNVFLYAAGGDHPLREPCRSIVERAARGRLPATTSSEVVQELIFVLARRGMLRQGVALARDVLALLPDLLPVGHREMAGACDLLERFPALPPRDAVHAATMACHGLDTVVSADPHFDQVSGLRRLAPEWSHRFETGPVPPV